MKTIQKSYRPQNPLFNEKDKHSKKHSDLRDIHKTLNNDRLKTYYDSYNNKNDASYYLNLSKKLKQRSKSQLSGYNQFSYQTFKKSKSPEAPINIFISVQKLNKMKINSNEHKKQKTKRSILSNLSKKRSNIQLQQQVLNPLKYMNRKKGVNQSTLKQTIDQIKKNSLNKKRFKTLQDQDLVGHKKSSLETKNNHSIRQNSNKQIPKNNKSIKEIIKEQKQTHPENEKLKYQELKYDYQRFPPGFKKYKLLGRGGFSLVWLGFHKKSKKAYAVKQILTKNKYQTHLKEIWLCNYFFANGKPRQQFQGHPGVKNLLMMYDYQIQQVDTWIVYEMCDGSLGSMLYDLYRQQGSEQQKFLIKYKSMYLKMRENPTVLKNLIIQIAKALDLLAKHNIVHSDLKTQNILIQQLKNSDSTNITYGYKLIDYGSSFPFTNLKQYTLATPQYMCPQLLNFILYQNKNEYNKQMLKVLKNYDNSSAIDVWGLGCVILEIVNGLPLWITSPTKLFYKGKYIEKLGLFSVENRSFRKIIEKQLEVLRDLDSFFENQNFSGVYLDDSLKSIIKRMLDLNPATRIRPNEILIELGVKIEYKKFSLVGDIEDLDK